MSLKKTSIKKRSNKKRKENLLHAFDILNVTPEAEDRTIREAYLTLIKKYTPEKDPAQFQILSDAYQTIKDRKSRLEYYLFNTDLPVNSPQEALIYVMQHSDSIRKPIHYERFKEFLRNG